MKSDETNESSLADSIETIVDHSKALQFTNRSFTDNRVSKIEELITKIEPIRQEIESLRHFAGKDLASMRSIEVRLQGLTNEFEKVRFELDELKKDSIEAMKYLAEFSRGNIASVVGRLATLETHHAALVGRIETVEPQVAIANDRISRYLEIWPARFVRRIRQIFRKSSEA